MEKDIDTNIYEAGYHLVPTLAEEAIAGEADKVKAIVTAEGGEIISEALPELKNLAYDIEKFNKAYFGWVKFSATSEAIIKIKTALDASKTVVRHLIIGTVKESTLMADKEKRPSTRPEPAKERAKEDAIAPSESIDKTIDDLVIN